MKKMSSWNALTMLALVSIFSLQMRECMATPVSQCTEVQAPGTTSTATEEPGFFGRDPRAPTGSISYDGRFVSFLRQVDPNAPLDPFFLSINPETQERVKELFVYDIQTGLEKQLTSNTAQTYRNGFFISDGSYIARSVASLSFVFDPVSGTFVPRVAGIDLPSLRASNLIGIPEVVPAESFDEVIETPAAAQARLAGLPHSSRILSISADQDVYLMLENGPFLPLSGNSLTWYRRSDGEYIDIGVLVQQITGIVLPADSADYIAVAAGGFPISSNGMRITLESVIQLTGPQIGQYYDDFGVPGSTVIQGNVLGAFEAVFLLDLENETIVPIAEPDISQPRATGISSGLSVFVRNLGQTGYVAGLDRQVPLLNTLGNTDGTGEIYLFRSGEGLTQITSVPVVANGFPFDPGLAFISYDESALLFNSTYDLTGDNPTNDRQIFRYDVDSGQLFQVTRFRSSLREISSQLGLDLGSLNFRGAHQLSPAGLSADGKVIALNTTELGYRIVRTANGIEVRRSSPLIVCE